MGQPQQENTVNNLENLKAKLLSENNDISDWKYKAVSRVLKRIKNTEEPELGSDVKAI